MLFFPRLKDFSLLKENLKKAREIHKEAKENLKSMEKILKDASNNKKISFKRRLLGNLEKLRQKEEETGNEAATYIEKYKF